MTPTWDGKERRMTTNDHDLLINIANDCKHMKEWTVKHTFDDDIRHKDNLEKFDKINENDKWQNKIIYGAIGAVLLIEFASKFIK